MTVLICVAARVIDAPIEEVKVAEEKPIQSVVEPTSEVPANVEEVLRLSTEAPAAIEEVPVTESAPVVETSAIAAEETPLAATLEEHKAIDSGILGYKAPGLIK